MTNALIALCLCTGVQTLCDIIPFSDPINLWLTWLAEVAGILGMCAICVHVALAWAKSLVIMRTIAGLIIISAGVLIGMSVAIYLGLNSSSAQTGSFTHGELFVTLYGALIVAIITTTGITTLVTSIVTYARAGADRLPISIFGLAGLLTTVLGVMSCTRLAVTDFETGEVTWAVAATAAALYGLTQVANQRARTMQDA
ncbi:hypothetical protein [Nocardia colli]|uniref:hypothetical protein n=1 Tax=Nocardia colli TaxID=2545717 RepID=UPI0035D992DB